MLRGFVHAVQAEGARGIAGQAPGEKIDRHNVGIGDLARIITALIVITEIIEYKELNRQDLSDEAGFRAAHITEWVGNTVVDARKNVRSKRPLVRIAVVREVVWSNFQSWDFLPLSQPCWS